MGIRFLAFNHFKQAHQLRGREKVQANYIFWSVGNGSDLIGIQIRGVGCQDSPFRSVLIESPENLFFCLHVFKHGFNNKLGIRQTAVVRIGHQALTRYRVVRRSHSRAFNKCLQAGFDLLSCASTFCQSALQEHHIEPRLERANRDPDAHGATAHNTEMLNIARMRVFQSRNFGHRSFGEKHVSKGP